RGPGYLLQNSPFARLRKRLKLMHALALGTAFSGLMVSIAGILAISPASNAGLSYAVVGIALLTVGSLLALPAARKLVLDLARNPAGYAKGAGAPGGLETINDARWELADHASRYRQLLDAQREFVIKRSMDGRLVFANRAFCDAFGIESEGVIGSRFRP